MPFESNIVLPIGAQAPDGKYYTNDLDGDGVADDLLYYNDFSSGLGHTQNGVSIFPNSEAGSVVVVPGVGHGGQHGCEFRFGPDADGEDSNAELRIDLGANVTELAIAYRLFIPLNYVHRTQDHVADPERRTANNKSICQFWADVYSNLDNFIGFEAWPNSEGAYLSAHLMYGGTDHGHVPGVGGSSVGSWIDTDDLGYWAQYSAYIKLDTTPGGTSGIVRARKKVAGKPAQLIYERTNFPFLSVRNYLTDGYVLGWSNSGFANLTTLIMSHLRMKKDSGELPFMAD